MATGKFEVKANKVKETKGAVRYEEVNADGRYVDYTNAKVGVFYIRKSAFAETEIPDQVQLTVSW